jgi:hypothetical protein
VEWNGKILEAGPDANADCLLQFSCSRDRGGTVHGRAKVLVQGDVSSDLPDIE